MGRGLLQGTITPKGSEQFLGYLTLLFIFIGYVAWNDIILNEFKTL
jgi:hypothetical protein